VCPRRLLAALQLPTCILSATLDLLLKYLDTTLATYKKKLKHVCQTLVKILEKHLKTVAKHTQHPDKTITIYV
jgi:hypothetical protein